MTFAPVIRTQSDLERAWRTLMEPLGFSGHSVWLMFLGPDDRPLPQLTEIEDCVGVPDDEHLHGLAHVIEAVLTEVAPGGRVGFLRTRPGRDAVSADDRAWAAALHAACTIAGVRGDVVHVANDVRLAPVPLDDLPLRRTAS
ncbi:MAG: hypothetical protein WKF79_03835 [Nocardioides sp.]